MLKHKGYVGYVVYDDEAHIFHGEVIGVHLTHAAVLVLSMLL